MRFGKIMRGPEFGERAAGRKAFARAAQHHRRVARVIEDVRERFVKRVAHRCGHRIAVYRVVKSDGHPVAFAFDQDRIGRARSRCSLTARAVPARELVAAEQGRIRSEEHTSELPSLMRISYAVFCLKKNTYHKR